MKKFHTIQIAGNGGQGIQLAGNVLARALVRSGMHVCDLSEYPSRILGGISTYRLTFSHKKVHAAHRSIDLLFALTKEALHHCKPHLSEGGVLLYDASAFSAADEKDVRKIKQRFVACGVNMKEELVRIGSKPIAENFFALGIIAYATGLSLRFLESVAAEFFSGPVLAMNTRALRAGFAYARKSSIQKITSLSEKKSKHGNIFLSGNEAVALSAVASGCTMYIAYPMSPATSILHTLARWSEETGIRVKQVHDEIEAASMAIGASYTGARTLIATSGGGFALMAESISGAAMAEVPIVIIDAQRPGPATGLPTWTEQGDLAFAAHVGHGDFPRVVLAPGDVEETFYLLNRAFNIAEKYQTPVIVLLDKYLSDGHLTLPAFNGEKIEVERGKIASQNELRSAMHFQRYAKSKDGVSKRTFPGQRGGTYVANTDEHDEYGFSIEGFDAKTRIAQMQKRGAKISGIMKEMPRPKFYGNPKAKKTIVGWGSIKGPVLEAMNMLSRGECNFLHFTGIMPLDKTGMKKVMPKNSVLYLLENNFSGQFGKILEEAGVRFKKKITKYDGSQFYPEEIIHKISNSQFPIFK